jgi:2,4-diketo-3-deoxy-L-fuconate hydrolase
VEAKVKAVVKDVAGKLDNNRPAYVHPYTAVKADRPFMPREALYAFSNYPNVTGNEAAEKKPLPPPMPGLWDRPADNPLWVTPDGKDARPQNPYAFLMPAGAPKVFSGDHDPIIIYDKRSKVEYECELLGVLGKEARRVPPDKVKDYMFGYANSNDVSDRQSRQPDPVNGDWLSQKGYDGYKPIGPFIVPKEFVDPVNEDMKFVLTDASGVAHVLQEHNTKFAYHSVYDYISWASNIHTLPVGMVLSLGTPPGSHGGLGRSMLPGDVNQCSYKGLGILTNVVQKEGELRSGLN